MARSLNKVMLIGNIGSDPEIRMTPSGSKVAKFSLATNRTYQDRTGQQQERTDWHRLTFFGKLADIVEQWVHKGDRLYVEGRIEYSPDSGRPGWNPILDRHRRERDGDVGLRNGWPDRRQRSGRWTTHGRTRWGRGP